MSSPIENIKEQVCRLEDLLKLYISQEKEQAEQLKDDALETLSTMRRVQDQTLSGFVVAITILLGLTQLPFLKNGDSNSNSIIYLLVSAMIILLVLGFILYRIHTRWRQNTAGMLRELVRSYEASIEIFEKILEYSIRVTLEKFEGKKDAVVITGNAILILKFANELYQIKSHEKISKLDILPDFRQEYHKKQAEYLKSIATSTYEEYVKLDRKKIPEAMRHVICSVFYDNEEYIKIE